MVYVLFDMFNALCIFQVLHEYIFCSGMVHGHFGIFNVYPRRLLPTTEKIGDVESLLVVEEDESFPDPLQYLQV